MLDFDRSIQPLIINQDDKNRVKRKFKNAIVTRYTASDQFDLQNFIGSKDDWYQGCGNSLIDQANSKKEKEVFNQFIEQIIDEEVKPDWILDKDLFTEIENYQRFNFDKNEVKETIESQKYLKNYNSQIMKLNLRESKPDEILDQQTTKNGFNFQSLEDLLKAKSDQQTILYIIFSELIREVSQKDKELGYLIMKSFSSYFTKNEKKWLSIFENQTSYIQKLKNDVDLLIGLSTNQEQGAFKATANSKQIRSLLDNKALNEQNLIDHKIMIQKLIGEYHKLEDEHYHQSMKQKYFDKDINQLLYDWDQIRISEQVKKAIDEVDPLLIVENLKFTDEYKNMGKDQMAVLVNAQRFLMSLKKQNPWEGEIKYFKIKNKDMQQKLEDLKDKVSYLEEIHKQDQKLLAQKEDLIMMLKATLEKATSTINMRQLENVGVQTIIDQQNLGFIIQADKILEATLMKQETEIQRLIRNAKLNLSKFTSIKMESLLEIVQATYSKKIQYKQQKHQNYHMLQLQDYVYLVFQQRYNVKEKVNKKCEKFLSLLDIFSLDYEKYSITFEEAISKYQSVFTNINPTLKFLLVKSIIKSSRIVVDQETYNKRVKDFKALISKILPNEVLQIYIEKVDQDQFYNETFQKYQVDNDYIDLMKCQNAMKQKVNFQVQLKDFLNDGLTFAITYFDDLKKSYKKLFQEFDSDLDGFIDYDQFDGLVRKINKSMKEWKILAMFQVITGKERNYESGKVTFDQFLAYSMSIDLMDGVYEIDQTQRDQRNNSKLSHKMTQ
eukprot:403355569